MSDKKKLNQEPIYRIDPRINAKEQESKEYDHIANADMQEQFIQSQRNFTQTTQQANRNMVDSIRDALDNNKSFV